MQKALITGGSGGIGLELARVMAAEGHDLVIVARNKKQLEKVKKQLEKQHKVSVDIVVADLAKPDAAAQLYKQLKNENIEILVNNAGIGLVGDFFEEDIKRNRMMADLNINTLMELTHYFGKDFVKNDRGHILNIASIASFLPGPKQPVYYATKAFVRSFTRALAYNLRSSNVTVTALHPGPTKTHFFEAADAGSFKSGASPVSVAKLGYKAMMNGKVETTHGLYNRFIANVLTRITPYRMQTAIVDKASEI